MSVAARQMFSVTESFERLQALAPKGLIRFLSIGLIGLAVDSAVFAAFFYLLHLDKALARALALPIATCVTWVLNRRHTFEATGRAKRDEVMRYAIVTLCAQGVSYTVFLGVCAMAPKMPPNIALVVGAVVAAAFSYSGQRFFTFAPVKAG
jgi:putative flippase GtrA